ncbi:MAG: polyribonucleotide nucleotidyltransferase [Alphaproteobacteria bacterium]|nr:polyribonucleotide nucleotidyltransferase [Rickettsiales bacterium]
MSLEGKNYSISFGKKELSFNIGKIARQAHGSVLVSYGDTVVLCAAVIGSAGEERDFLPLTVNYTEKFYAVGKIPGGYLKREGRPSTGEVLTSRVIDRTLRPLFAKGFSRDVQVSCTLLSYDPDSDNEVATLIGAVLACGLAGAPIAGMMAGCRVGYVNGEYILNPATGLADNKLDLFVSSTNSSIFMVESEASELGAKEMVGALKFAQESVQDVIKLMEEVVQKHGRKKIDFIIPDYSELRKLIESGYADKISNAYTIPLQQDRKDALQIVRSEISQKFVSEEYSSIVVKSVYQSIEGDLMRKRMLSSKKRIDGRSFTEIRSLNAEINILPSSTVHGSALFTRGETQALVVTTLGGGLDEQMVNTVTDVNKKESFMLHYNFPPYSVGEATPQRPTGRREIGHGNLAYRALKSVLPSKDEFAYTIRVVSEITESNGSSSMATVCGSTLSLLATGVPLKASVSGIAMGLIKEGDDFAVLTDIMGDEDHFGDMDFKVAKTKKGITALQMDIKISGVSLEIMSIAIDQAVDACGEILKVMDNTVSSPLNIGASVPKVEEIKIPVKKIAELIGKSGANIKAICEETESKIDIDQDGMVRIFAPNAEKMSIAKQMVIDSVSDIEVGKIYPGTIDRLMPFGALVVLPGNKNGMVHISEIANERIEDIADYLGEGDSVMVKVLGFDDRRRIKLSIKQAEKQ